MLNNGNTSALNDEFTKLKIIPFIAKRHKRQRANNRERSRMQTLNEALIILKQHLPIDLYLKSKTNLQSQTEITENDKQLLKEKSLEFVKMTKIDILKFATEYIKLLTNVLNSDKLFQSSKPNFYPLTCVYLSSTDVRLYFKNMLFIFLDHITFIFHVLCNGFIFKCWLCF